MLKGVYKQWLLLFVLMLASLYTIAQQHHFLYIQADNQQPFYVKYNGKNYSSSSIGYLILPKLNDGNISLQIGFPRNLYTEQNFNLSIAGKDLGYALKNFNEKGWGLFNFQTTDIVMNGNASSSANEQSAKTITNTGNAFGNMLASAINDSTLNQQRVTPHDSSSKTIVPASSGIVSDTLKTVADSKAQKDTAKAMADVKPLKDTAGAASQTSLQPYTAPAAVDSLEKKYSSDNNTNTHKKTVDSSNQIIKSSEKTTSNGTDLTFLDNAGKDTIHAFIPSSNTEIPEAKTVASDSTKTKVNNPFFNNNTTTNTSQPALSDTLNTNNAGAASQAQVNTGCGKMFSNSDADKLKKKIISLSNQDDILNAVRKSLRDKCISTDQVKDLGNLFLSDENRYGFYDTAYPFVYDYGNYAQLQNTLIDTYYKNRFKALLR